MTSSRLPASILNPRSSAPAVEIVVQVQGLSVRREIAILDRIDWTIERGQHWVILGSNGAGKTCLLNALAGFLPPTRGSIAVLGERFGRADWRELRKRIGLVSSALRQQIEPSELAEVAVASGREAVINYWGTPRRADIQKARQLLDELGCGELPSRPWGVLSQGERQRVLIARALMADPALLILDEPCAGLDPVAREAFLGLVTKLCGGNAANPAIIFVTHHVEEIVPEIGFALVLKSGRVLAAGPCVSVIRAPILSEAFGATVRLSRSAGRFRMQVAAKPWLTE